MKMTKELLFLQSTATWFGFSGPRERHPGLNLVFLSSLKIRRVEKFLILSDSPRQERKDKNILIDHPNAFLYFYHMPIDIAPHTHSTSFETCKQIRLQSKFCKGKLDSGVQQNGERICRNLCPIDTILTSFPKFKIKEAQKQ